MNPDLDIRWKQRFRNFDRAFVLPRQANFEIAVNAIHTRYLAAIEQLHGFLQERAVP